MSNSAAAGREKTYRSFLASRERMILENLEEGDTREEAEASVDGTIEEMRQRWVNEVANDG